MANLGFLGLGIMGYPMARNLARAGHSVAVWSNTAAKAARLAGEESGVTACGSPREVAERSECTFLCVGDTKMSEAVILGEDGVIAGATAGTVVVDTSTISPTASVAISGRLKEKGVDLLDAPVTGSKPGAENGTLTFMVGGAQEALERCRPWFEAMGKQIFYCGGPGFGLHVKLTLNLFLANVLQAMSEGLVLSTKAGVDPELMLQVLDSTGGKSALVSYKSPSVLARDFSTAFSVKWLHKDLALMLESAAELKMALPMTAMTHQMAQAAIAEGFGEEDMSSVIKVVERIAGVEVKKS